MNHVPHSSKSVAGGYVGFEHDSWYKITNSDQMPEFFINPVSSSDHWMFVSSHGALSAGRRNPDSALFPYYSADKLIDTVCSSGPKTIVRVQQETGNTLWEPFHDRLTSDGSITRNLYKNFLGNKLAFEEINRSLGLSFSYRWSFGHKHGFLRTCQLANLHAEPVRISLLDGIQNVLPYGIEQSFQLRFSNLGDAYKKSELLLDSQMGLFYLSSIPTDRAEPSEGLRATIAWQMGLEDPTVLLSTKQLDRFRHGQSVEQETDIRGQRGAYFVTTQLELAGESCTTWNIVANVNQDHADVIDLQHRLREPGRIQADIADDIADNSDRLLRIVSSADGRQQGSDPRRIQRHQANTLFNAMRGGIPVSGYTIGAADFRKHIHQFNSVAYDRNQSFLKQLPESIDLPDLISSVEATQDADLRRISMEYLPFTYSRRHGDPTRPWNSFSIDLFDSEGTDKVHYEGNWRDIFQNWEALLLSYPAFSQGMILRFVNASTADGYNPYRITKDGFDWELLDAEDPWANIGYWGDHQIIYLLKLLEWSRKFSPSQLDQSLAVDCCTYAQIPYRIRDYAAICRNPQETIDFDSELAESIQAHVDRIGADGKLTLDSDGMPRLVNLAEKLLLPALVKLTNFIPGGGVWLNTQRPEWNDANNAIVGRGLSMVTTCYLRRFFTFMTEWFQSPELPTSVSVSREIAALLQSISTVLEEHTDDFKREPCDSKRKTIVDALSTIGSDYRLSLYTNGLTGARSELNLNECVDFFQRCLAMLDDTIRGNRRDDGLYHSYNLLSIEDSGYRVERLQEMLEGQVAVLSSGLLTPNESLEVLDALRSSRMYREDQQSYMLYPDRELPTFIEKNSICKESASHSQLIHKLLRAGVFSIVREDRNGKLHFNGDFRNAEDLNAALDDLETVNEFAALVQQDRAFMLELFEQTFHHSKFTGRSGTFFAYEGLGSVYWHMVSKLSLATLETYLSAQMSEADDQTLQRLLDHYHQICDGIGCTKTPLQYGAFPSDPYSHTPNGAGAQQPGMTGQVKEDILSRFTELGVRVNEGILSFDPSLFDSAELLNEKTLFRFINAAGEHVALPLSAGMFAYTFCQVPVIYFRSTKKGLVVNYKDQTTSQRDHLALTADESTSLFKRRDEIASLEIQFNF
ncbi:MAG: hypothetical protein AB8B91_22060 [Rubripirellula sp.]